MTNDDGKSPLSWARDFLRQIQKAIGTFPYAFKEQNALMEEIPVLLRALDDPPDLALVGVFKSGKSSTLNALLGADIAPVDPRPATAKVTRFRQGVERVRFYREDGWIEGTIDSFRRVVDQNARNMSTDVEADQIRWVEVQNPSPLLRDLELIDTPGFRSGYEAHDREADAILADVSAVAWVFDAATPPTPEDLKRIRNSTVRGQPRFAILNRADDQSPDDRLRIKKDFQRNYGHLFTDVFLFSAVIRRELNAGRPVREAECRHLTLDLERAILDKVRLHAARIRATQVVRKALTGLEAVKIAAEQKAEDLSAFEGAVREQCERLREFAKQRGKQMAEKIIEKVQSECKAFFRRFGPDLKKVVRVEGISWSKDYALDSDALRGWLIRCLEATAQVREAIESVIEATFSESFAEIGRGLERLREQAPSDLVVELELARVVSQERLETKQQIIISRTAGRTEAFLDGCLCTIGTIGWRLGKGERLLEHGWRWRQVYPVLSLLLGKGESLLERLHGASSDEAAQFFDELIADEHLSRWIARYLNTRTEDGTIGTLVNPLPDTLDEIVISRVKGLGSEWGNLSRNIAELLEQGRFFLESLDRGFVT
jgi:hypothetical protein